MTKGENTEAGGKSDEVFDVEYQRQVHNKRRARTHIFGREGEETPFHVPAGDGV